MTTNNARGLCYKCKYRKELVYSCHSECTYPESKGIPSARAMMYYINGSLGDAVVGSKHGFDNGWFLWPSDFDPVWLEKCDFYEAKEDTDAKHPSGDGTVQQGMV